MKVLILGNSDVGLYKFRRELIDELLRPGSYIEGRTAKPCEVFISLPDEGNVPELKSMGCRFIDTSIERRGVNPLKDIKLLMKYRKILNDIKPDIVLGYTIKPNVYGGIACAQKNVPFVANITGLGTAVKNKGLLQFITLSLYRFALRKAKAVFFQNSQNERFFLKHKLYKGRSRMLPGSGVNLEYYKPIDYPSNDTIQFVFVARIMKEKGIDQYLEAAKYFCAKYSYMRFHVCGFCDQIYKDKIEELGKNGTIIYHGLVRDMREIYAVTHCTVHPSYYPEGLSNVLLESAATARPIITTNRAGCREVIEDKINGFLVKERDGKDLIDKIEKFVELSWEEKKQMGLNGRIKVEKDFDRKIVVESYIEELMQ